MPCQDRLFTRHGNGTCAASTWVACSDGSDHSRVGDCLSTSARAGHKSVHVHDACGACSQQHVGRGGGGMHVATQHDTRVHMVQALDACAAAASRKRAQACCCCCWAKPLIFGWALPGCAEQQHGTRLCALRCHHPSSHDPAKPLFGAHPRRGDDQPSRGRPSASRG